jgi:hypothetical protein
MALENWVEYAIFSVLIDWVKSSETHSAPTKESDMSRLKLAALGVAVLIAWIAAGPTPQAEARGYRAATLTKLGAGCCEPCCNPCPPPPVKQCITVCHPCTGCPVQVEVCVPACCTGAPSVCCRRTLFGAGAVDLEWCCGFTAVVRFQRCGDYRVVYR